MENRESTLRVRPSRHREIPALFAVFAAAIALSQVQCAGRIQGVLQENAVSETSPYNSAAPDYWYECQPDEDDEYDEDACRIV